MYRSNRQRVRHQDKVVFVLDANSQNRITPKSEDTFIYVKSIIDVMLQKSKISTDTVFVGGSTRDLCMWVSGLIEFYQFNQIDIQDNTYNIDYDPDFDVPNKFN